MTTLRVKAIQSGYYGHVRRDPDTELGTFVLKDEAEFSAIWMEPVGWEPSTGKAKKAKAVVVEPVTPKPSAVQPIQSSLETVVTPSEQTTKTDI